MLPAAAGKFGEKARDLNEKTEKKQPSELKPGFLNAEASTAPALCS